PGALFSGCTRAIPPLRLARRAPVTGGHWCDWRCAWNSTKPSVSGTLSPTPISCVNQPTFAIRWPADDKSSSPRPPTTVVRARIVRLPLKSDHRTHQLSVPCLRQRLATEYTLAIGRDTSVSAPLMAVGGSSTHSKPSALWAVISSTAKPFAMFPWCYLWYSNQYTSFQAPRSAPDRLFPGLHHLSYPLKPTKVTSHRIHNYPLKSQPTLPPLFALADVDGHNTATV
ncbi:hypothetical protein LZ30DRAFT_807989, partial [Colletotrichum cereale]